MATDSDAFDRLQSLVTKTHVGGFLVFGASEPVPPVLLNATYGSTTLGQAHAAAATLNRLQALAKVPLLNSADFEFGVGMRIAGGTQFPRAMAFGAAGDPMLAEQAGRIVAEESRAIGVHVDFAPVADVNNNPRNPVINTRSFGEDPQRVGEMAAAFVRGLRAGGMIATLKHFPGHGDTAVDTHLGLASIPHDRARLEAIELRTVPAGACGRRGRDHGRARGAARARPVRRAGNDERTASCPACCASTSASMGWCSPTRCRWPRSHGCRSRRGGGPGRRGRSRRRRALAG